MSILKDTAVVFAENSFLFGFIQTTHQSVIGVPIRAIPKRPLKRPQFIYFHTIFTKQTFFTS